MIHCLLLQSAWGKLLQKINYIRHDWMLCGNLKVVFTFLWLQLVNKRILQSFYLFFMWMVQHRKGLILTQIKMALKKNFDIRIEEYFTYNFSRSQKDSSSRIKLMKQFIEAHIRFQLQSNAEYRGKGGSDVMWKPSNMNLW